MEKEKIHNLKDYKVYIVDVDGTLYFKKPMQIMMAINLALFYAFHLYRFKELFMLRDYRIMRDKEDFSGNEEFENIIIRNLSEKYNFSEKKTTKIVEKWILKKPLDILFRCRDKHLISFLTEQRNSGKRIFIYSDYPAVDKCESLGIKADGIYWPDKVRISVLKPSSQGINYILKENQIEKGKAVFIGDRYEKDGKCAEGVGVDFLILDSNRTQRDRQYKSLRETRGF